MPETTGDEHPDPMDEMRLPWTPDSEVHFLTNWIVCGVFPNPPNKGDEIDDRTLRVQFETDYLKEHGGETRIRPKTGMKHERPDGTEAEWQELEPFRNKIDFLRRYWGDPPPDNKVAYAYTTVKREEAGDALLAVGSDDGIRIWVNGKLVHDHLVARGLHFDDDIVPVRFREGNNHILVKVENRHAGWGFAMRITDTAELKASATVSTEPRAEITLFPDKTNSFVEIDSDAALTEYALYAEMALVEVLGPGGECVAREEAPRGDTVRFDTKEWPDGPYDVQVSWTGEAGRRVCLYCGLYVGDWRSAVVDILNTCERVPADSRTEKSLRLRLIKDFIIDRLGNDPREGDPVELKEDGWRAIHFALMEYSELQKGPQAEIRPGGFVRLAWIDELDDSPQFCRVYLPLEYDGKKQFPMIVKLHGYNPHNPPYIRWWLATGRHGAQSKIHPVIEIVPHGRGNTGYSGIGERDVMRAVALAQQKLKVDADRIYIMGYSMGGGGTWHVGTRHPDVFAALTPVYGGWDYHCWASAEDLANMTPLERFMKEARSSYSHAEALLTTPLLVLHGDADILINPDYSRYVTKLMQRWGYDVRYWEKPGWGHSELREEYKVAEWMLEHRLNRNPHEVRVRSGRLGSAKAHWVEVEQREHPFELIEVHARLVNPETVSLECKNVLQLKLTPGSKLVNHERPLNIIWNGRFAGKAGFQDGAVVVRDPGYKPSPGEKTALVGGPLRERNSLPFAIVCGTTSKDMDMRRICRARAEVARDGWRAWQHTDPRFFLDTEVTDDIIRKYSLILYGGPEANSVTAKLIDELPLDIRDSEVTVGMETFPAKDSAIAVICPNPRNRERYVTVLAATSRRGMYFCDRMDDAFDFCIKDFRTLEHDDLEWGDLNIVMGTFDHKWKYDEEYVVRGDSQLRSRAKLMKGPSITSAKTDAETLYVSDLLELRAQGSFTHMRRDASWYDQPIKLGGKTYDKGIGVNTWNATHMAEYDLTDCGWKRLKATIGMEIRNPDEMEPQSKKSTGVYFVVLGDGKKLYRSRRFKWDSQPEDIDIDISGVKILGLQVGQTAKFFHRSDSVDWADLRLEK